MAQRDEKVVFFDVGGTLLYSNPPVPEVFCRVASSFGYDVELPRAEALMEEVDRYYLEQYERDGDFWCDNERAIQIWKDMYELMARGCGIEERVDEISQVMYDEYLNPACWSLFPEVPECLETLKSAGARLGVISNWDNSLESILEGLGVLEYFDVVMTSSVEKCRKPYPEMFLRALERMGVDASQAYHVGDYVEADGAAAAVGITPIIVNRYGWIDECGFALVDDLSAVPGLVFPAYDASVIL